MDKGPWKVETWTRTAGKFVIVQSDDFKHDVSLEISGDFGDKDELLAYAEWLAGVLNRASSNGIENQK